MPVTAIVPLKSLSAAKGRLAEVLAPDDRRAFAAWMAGCVLDACLACDAVDDVLLVAGDAAAARVGQRPGVRVLQVDEPGLQRALDAADVAVRGTDVSIVVAADLPEVTPVEIATVVDLVRAAGGPAVVVAPTLDGGTGALARRPSDVMSTAYGPGSGTRHAELARAAGIPCTVVSHPGLAADVDTPEQLSAALARSARDDVGCRPQ